MDRIFCESLIIPKKSWLIKNINITNNEEYKWKTIGKHLVDRIFCELLIIAKKSWILKNINIMNKKEYN